MSPQSITLALPAPRIATGPRTAAGKQRSKHNATKHGIFSQSLLLHNESPTEYHSLLTALRDSFRPRGGIEHLLVEKLATLLWRHRRLLVAERAEIDKGVDSLASQEDQKQLQAENFQLTYSDQDYGMMRRLPEPGVLESCLALLGELRDGIQREGFVPPRDSGILTKLFGRCHIVWAHQTLLDSYEAWRRTAEVPEAERQQKGYASPEECRRRIVREIDREIRALKRAEKARRAMESSRRSLEILRRSVPDAPELDRLLRYEAALERAFERALSQLERLQRLRTGQPVPPEIPLRLAR